MRHVPAVHWLFSSLYFLSISMLYLVGLGLGDESDITVKGLRAVQSCDIIYLEHYTAILDVTLEQMVWIM